MKTLSPAEPLIFDDKTIIPIEETIVCGNSLTGSTFLYALKKPNAIVVMSNGTIKAYDMNLDEVPVETLVKETEGLKDIIESNR